jgi:hypothetical protein
MPHTTDDDDDNNNNNNNNKPFLNEFQSMYLLFL